MRLRGRLHGKARDAAAISAHYDVSNRFYELFLGPSMTYSCAVFEHEDDPLDRAQWSKYDLICRKLDLREGKRLLDIGCGWGGMALHAARNYGVHAVGVTISREQYEFARKRIADAGLNDRVEIRLEDYRDVHDGPYDAISSIGMFEHVGERRLATYMSQAMRLLGPAGSVRRTMRSPDRDGNGPGMDPDGFVNRYVFPDGELLELGQIISAMHAAGFEVRHAETLREHYERTLRHWVANLEERWDEAVTEVGTARARIWRLYMAGSALVLRQPTTSRCNRCSRCAPTAARVGCPCVPTGRTPAGNRRITTCRTAGGYEYRAGRGHRQRRHGIGHRTGTGGRRSRGAVLRPRRGGARPGADVDRHRSLRRRERGRAGQAHASRCRRRAWPASPSPRNSTRRSTSTS